MIFWIIKASRLQLILRSLIVIGSSLLLTVILQIFQFRDVKAGITWFFKYHSILGLTTAGIIFVFYLALIGIFNRFWYATGLIYFILLIFSFVNSKKSMLRNEPLLPSDLAMYKEANSLIGMVNIKSVLMLLAILIIGIGLAFWLQHHFKRDKGLPWYFRVLILVPCCLTIGGIFTLNHANSISNKFAAKIKDSRDFWSPLSGAINNGPLLSFINNVDSEVMAKPKKYNEKTMSVIAKRYQKYATAINKTRPNSNLNKQTLIYVLSESFSDPVRVPNLNVSTDPISNIRNIKSKTTSGLMLSSGYGGGTANMEYMTDTGAAINLFSPTLSTPFTQLVPGQKIAPNITNLFKTKNAIHTYLGNFYRRTEVYKKFGFQTFRNTQSTGNQKLKFNKTIEKSDLIGDNEAYKDVLWQVKQQKSGQFISLVTMQNHLPFTNRYNHDSYTVSGSATGSNKKTIENYIEGISLTDKSTAAFLKQLDNLNKPITVLWYGDHLAGIYSGDSMAQYNVSLHETDYFIYSNRYAREHGQSRSVKASTKIVSPNTFSALVLAHMGQKVSPYYAFLTKVQEKLPAMALDSQGDADGLMVNQKNKQVHYKNLTKKQKQLYNDYKLIQYDLTAGKQYLVHTKNFMK